jgi:hypothetical protein
MRYMECMAICMPITMLNTQWNDPATHGAEEDTPYV